MALLICKNIFHHSIVGVSIGDGYVRGKQRERGQSRQANAWPKEANNSSSDHVVQKDRVFPAGGTREAFEMEEVQQARINGTVRWGHERRMEYSLKEQSPAEPRKGRRSPSAISACGSLVEYRDPLECLDRNNCRRKTFALIAIIISSVPSSLNRAAPSNLDLLRGERGVRGQ
jgi:hypothetical protein